MKDKTKAEYLSIANNFISKNFDDPSEVTPKKLTDALIRDSVNYRPNYWRRLKCALKYHQRDYPKSLERLEKLKNPIWKREGIRFVPKPGLTVKPKQDRLKSAKTTDLTKFIDLFRSRDDYESIYGLLLVKYLGVRPSEMATIVCSGSNFFIGGSKKTENGLRGQDRRVSLPELSSEISEMLNMAVAGMQGKTPAEIKSIGERIRNASKKLFPRRKKHYNFYAFRHQMGSDLKASSMSRKEVAYLMGHQSTLSIEQYGNKRSASGKIFVRPADPKGVEKVREKHKSIPKKTKTVRYKTPDNGLTLK